MLLVDTERIEMSVCSCLPRWFIGETRSCLETTPFLPVVGIDEIGNTLKNRKK